MKKAIAFYTLLLSALLTFAQGETTNGGAMTGHHKLPVVVAVIGIILAVIFFFLFSMERRLKKLENK